MSEKLGSNFNTEAWSKRAKLDTDLNLQNLDCLRTNPRLCF